MHHHRGPLPQAELPSGLTRQDQRVDGAVGIFPDTTVDHPGRLHRPAEGGLLDLSSEHAAHVAGEAGTHPQSTRHVQPVRGP